MSNPFSQSELHRGIRGLFRDVALDVGSFRQRIARCDLGRCAGMCCYDGVYLRRREAELLAGLVGEFAEELSLLGVDLRSDPIEQVRYRNQTEQKTRAVESRRWEAIDDFPDHFSGTACVFLRGDSTCALQSLAVEKGEHPWAWKPLTCWLHPMELVRIGNRQCLTLPSTADDPQTAPGYPGFASHTGCGRSCSAGLGALAYEVLKPELDYLSEIVGRDFYRELAEG